MKAKEFLSELTVGKYATGGTTPSKDPVATSAFRKNSKIAYDIVKSVSNAPTSKDKIEILANLDAGRTANKIVVIGPSDKRYAFQSYDSSTGKLTVSISNTLYTVDVDSLEFLGKERIMSGSLKKWLFKTDNLEVQGKMEPNPNSPKKPSSAKPKFVVPNRLW